MKYYKYLPELNWCPVSEKLKQYVIDNAQTFLTEKNYTINMWNHLNKNELFTYVPEIIELFKPMNLTIFRMAFFITGSRHSSIHRDEDPKTNFRITLPVLNCENTETRFYTTIAETSRIEQPDGVPYNALDPKKCTHVDSYFLDKPVVVRINEPHQVFVEKTAIIPRVSCTIAFNEDISYLLED